MIPCRTCITPKRKPGCKGTCPEYAAWLPGERERKETIARNKVLHQFPYTKGGVKK